MHKYHQREGEGTLRATSNIYIFLYIGLSEYKILTSFSKFQYEVQPALIAAMTFSYKLIIKKLTNTSGTNFKGKTCRLSITFDRKAANESFTQLV